MTNGLNLAIAAWFLVLPSVALGQQPPARAYPATAPMAKPDGPVYPTTEHGELLPPARYSGGLALAPVLSGAISIDAVFRPIQKMGETLVTDWIGLSVMNPVGEMLGVVKDIVFDKNGQIVSVIVGVERFLGIDERVTSVAFGSVRLSTDGSGKQVALISATREQFEAAPTFMFVHDHRVGEKPNNAGENTIPFATR